ncbi:hypothetical protein [Deinococcus sedimenti]|uniref:Uncharacterized protein n=1 Tax=Deinococcus sedimenti TaxID=1867090 RepID=A0ABQ2S800_9DEIO|nr:hypothetical protein [Deinococcus sedimenti]GGS06701.1 hypothetical protein GCM10008960_36370 [Deinococcus sedimenti]
MTLKTIPRERPGFALAFLARAGLSEIVVRRAGVLVERRYFTPVPEQTCTAFCGCPQCIEARR